MPIFHKPKYSTVQVKKKDIPQGLWQKCPASGEIIYNKELEQNQNVVPKSGYHFPIGSQKRLDFLLDSGSWEEFDKDLKPNDPLGFVDTKAYKDRVSGYQAKTGMNDSVIDGLGKIHGIPISIAVMDFKFGGGSLGSVAGEKIARTIERALEMKIPCIIVSCSGGARMQEGILSLMQMAKTSAALAKLSKAKLPFISVLTNPTTGGVTASYAALGDVIISEPGALIGFAGRRVIKETTNEDLPEGFQSAEFLLEAGLIDMVVDRREMRDSLRDILSALYLGKQPKTA
ncbi:MAG: acetyl-CoA carboxylase carboxyltransferase subunit beta [Opitutales bacterium]|jgi:acetyl-CoA carboxylase carboxyl transferase subunit beta|nr:acetyl-CoA carboxylase carboxyltransferase subunit beta [Opitutales bacterium]MBT5167511.1 acetyl-CoA carboxylase carboxyltransferase subunit beta [Opitutales bacterium]MBT5813441.1 acetyl-CoA carboxylase carboxyltransferase subunit beta [Opitutales bacterium]MBT6380707.1 acetyl-CoA carboxylase carboxyltransferase subunit beta [Opitutales bacterium]MBT6768870.1 acetyl-CoA carboxylase carboxyltransferase subunit beta [Opitutales bacterium]